MSLVGVSMFKFVLKISRFTIATLVLASCKQDVPVLLAISSPASGATVSGKVAVQISTPEGLSGTARVLVRGKGSQAEGIVVGSAVSSPFVVTWETGKFPNQTPLEIYATLQDTNGKLSRSDPIEVNIENAGVPKLNYVAAFTIPAKPSSAISGFEVVDGLLPSSLPFEFALPPSDIGFPNAPVEPVTPPALTTQQTTRDYVGEWGWDAVAGADGFGVYLSNSDAAGSYEKLVAQAASATGKQKFSKKLDVAIGKTVYGVITTVTGGGSTESGFSNADGATFLGPQSATTPASGDKLTKSEKFVWTANPGAVGYIYYVYDKNPWAADAKLLCGNYPNSISQTEAPVSDKCSALPAGTYYWWVAGVSFNKEGKADGFSYSDPVQFTLQ
jgi:hypothetical protein